MVGIFPVVLGERGQKKNFKMGVEGWGQICYNICLARGEGVR